MKTSKSRFIVPRRKWRYPASIERDYQRILRGIARALDEATQHHIELIRSLLTSRPDESDKDRKIILCREELVKWLYHEEVACLRQDETDSEYVQRLIKEAYISTGVTAKALAQAARIAQQVRGYNQGEFYDVLRSALKVDIFLPDPDLRKLVDEWTAENVRLIKSIPDQYFDKLQGIVSRGLQQGSLASDMGEEIQSLYGVTSRRAQLIARDQVATLNGLVSQQRQTTAGITFYQWSTSKDARVRESHADREGRYYSWPGSGAAGKIFNGKTILPPPSGGPPGVPINCRCVALPVIDSDLATNIPGMPNTPGQPEYDPVPQIPEQRKPRVTIDKALPGLPEERREQLRSEFESAPDSMQRLLQTVAYDTGYTELTSGQVSHYSFNNTINMGATLKPEEYNRTFWHESGHAVDHQITKKFTTSGFTASSSRDKASLTPFQKAIISDVEKFQKPSYTELANNAAEAAAKQKLREKVLDAVAYSKAPFRDHSAVSDIFSCATKNDICGRWGHSDAYLSQGPHFSSAEVFANLWQIHFNKDKAAIKFLKEVMPGTVAEFKRLIKKYGG